ncbi:MAG TPA: hypothetical protein VHV51_23665 [Polyangiaceae bacterium]|jgi:hypothetical protein|nr:hypothetical protein [Polyangiaceae bacterium]
MPFTVSCAACNTRFLLGDDLFRRKVSGKVVTVKCKHCNAEISVDATEPATLPSNEAPVAPRARPVPPRPKHREGESATGTPLPFGPTGTPLPGARAQISPANAVAKETLIAGSATATPLPKRPLPTGKATRTPLPAPNATSTPLPTGALLSIWDAAEKGDAPRKGPPPRPHAPARAPNPEPELLEEFDEVPPSSSDAPTLTALRHEAAPPKKPSPKKADDFLVNLSAGTGGILGAPTIDVSGLGSPPAAPVGALPEVEASGLPTRAGTIPLFDMSAVLPVANGEAKTTSSSLSPANLDLSIDVEMPASSASVKARERKHVAAPESRDEAAAPKAKRSGAAVWFALVAAAAGVVIVVGMRGRASSHRDAAEPQPSEHAPSALAENTASSQAPSVAPTNVATELNAPSEPSANPSATSESPNRVAVAPSVATTLAVATTSAGNAPAAKSNDDAKASEATPKEPATQAVEKPALAEKPATPAPQNQPPPAEPGTEFDRGAAVAALKAAAAEASSCRKEGDPSGTATLTITFAPSGRVTSANIQGPPFAGTPTGGCIANAMRHAHVPAFSGDRVTVSKTIVIQ